MPGMFQWSLITLATVVGAPSAAGLQPEPRRFAHDIRVTYDLSRMDLARVGQSGENWAILRVEAGPDFHPRGLASLPLPKSEDPIDWIGGTATRVARVNGAVAEGSWGCLVPVPKRVLFGIRPIYMDDESPGLCVCRVDGTLPGVDSPVLLDVSLIPDSWREEMGPALQFRRSHADLFEGAKDPARRKQLLALVGNQNAAVAYLAYRAAAGAGGLSPGEVPPNLLDAMDELGILADFLLLSHPTPTTGEDAFKQLAARIDAARSPAQLYGIAAACALDLATVSETGLPNRRPSYRLLLLIETRAAQLADGGPSDGYLADALKELRKVRHEIEVIERLRKKKVE